MASFRVRCVCRGRRLGARADSQSVSAWRAGSFTVRTEVLNDVMVSLCKDNK